MMKLGFETIAIILVHELHVSVCVCVCVCVCVRAKQLVGASRRIAAIIGHNRQQSVQLLP